jgi:lysine/ornithine N-monooxygenase
MSGGVDVAIVGAGPYGLSVAAHLRAAGVDYRHFGVPMRSWRSAMPQGMFLRSRGLALNLSDPRGTHTLEAFCAQTGRPYRSSGLPVALDSFAGYGQWFQSGLGLAVEEVLVTDLARQDGGFAITLSSGERLTARKVVVAVGVEHFAYVPPPLSSLPSSVCTHSSAHADPAALRGQDVIVVGAGQSALELAALLHERGASVRVLARAQRLTWTGEPLPPHRPLLRRLVEPEAGLGSGWNTWLYSHPDLFRHLPRATRIRRARTALGPAGAYWLRGRVVGQFPVLTGHRVLGAGPAGGGVRLAVAGGGPGGEITADHVIAATGYRTDLARLQFLDDRLRSALRPLAATPAVGRDYQSSVAGLYFIGPAVAPSFGPVMRFVLGATHAAAVVARQLVGTPDGRSRSAVPASQGLHLRLSTDLGAPAWEHRGLFGTRSPGWGANDTSSPVDVPVDRRCRAGGRGRRRGPGARPGGFPGPPAVGALVPGGGAGARLCRADARSRCLRPARRGGHRGDRRQLPGRPRHADRRSLVCQSRTARGGRDQRGWPDRPGFPHWRPSGREPASRSRRA